MTLPDRLRKQSKNITAYHVPALLAEAADEIERLQLLINEVIAVLATPTGSDPKSRAEAEERIRRLDTPKEDWWPSVYGAPPGEADR